MPLLDNYLPVQGSDYAGGVVNEFRDYRFDHGLRRPFLDDNDRPCVIVNTGRWTVEKGVRHPIREKRTVADVVNNMGIINPVLMAANANSLRKEAWIELDKSVTMAARQRLRAYKDLAGANSYGGFNAMSKMTLEYEAMSDPGFAVVDMDALTDGRTDAPLFKLRSLPLPITHSDFWFSQRRLDISKGSTPLDTTMAEAGARRIGESIEKTLLGLETGVTYGSQTVGSTAHDSNLESKVYGYTNFPYRLTKTNFTAPTGSNPEVTVQEVLAALEQLYANKFYGPFMIYHSIDWAQYLDNDYARLGGTNSNMTLRDRLKKIENVQDVRRLDFLTSTFTLIFVQMTSDVARAIDGMQPTTVQWESQGGMRQNFKIMAIQVPNLRADYSGNCGILHGTTA